MEIPDIDVVGFELGEARVEVLEQRCLIAGDGFGGEYKFFALGGKSGADHAFVVAVLVDARGIEVVDAEIGGAGDDAGVGGDHAAEADGGNLEAGLAQGAVSRV